MDYYLQHKRKKKPEEDEKRDWLPQRPNDQNGGDDVELDEVPPAVRYQELRELTKLRYVMRRRRKASPTTWWQKALRWYIYPTLDQVLTVVCFWLPEVYKERHRKLSYAVLESETWPYMFTDPKARRRAGAAWKNYANSLVDEWNSSNVITALILTAAVSFLAVPDINNVSRYALMVTLLSSLASLAHASYHAHYYRNILDDRHYNILQLRCYLSCYRPIHGYLLCQPLLNLFWAMGAFSVGIVAYLWPVDLNAIEGSIWKPPMSAKVLIPIFYAGQLGLIGASYKWNRSAFFTTNELLVGEEGRRTKVMEDEELRGQKMLEVIQRDEEIARSVPIVNESNEQQPFQFLTEIPLGPMESLASEMRHRGVPNANSQPTEGPSSSDDLRFPTPLISKGPVRWVQDSMSHIPDDATPLGFEDSFNPSQLYVGKLFYEGRWRIGKVGPHILSSIPCNGREISSMTEYDVLCGDPFNFAWYKVSEGDRFDPNVHIPDTFQYLTVETGQDSERVYIAAGDIKGARHLGEVTSGATAARITFWRKELHITPFFVLLVKKGSMSE